MVSHLCREGGFLHGDVAVLDSLLLLSSLLQDNAGNQSLFL